MTEDWLGPPAHATVVHEPEDPVEYTGLLDADGVPLIRFRRPIGFLTEEVARANLRGAHRDGGITESRR